MTAEWKCWRNRAHPIGRRKLLGWPECLECGAAPQYFERARLLPDGLILDLLVPIEGTPTRAIIAARSGVVGLPFGIEGLSLVYYEGWTNGAMQYEDLDARGRWEGGVEHAASRLVTAYPTIAQMAVANAQLRKIGTYDPKAREATVTDEAALTAWLE